MGRRLLATVGCAVAAAAFDFRAEQKQETQPPRNANGGEFWSDTDFDMNGAFVIGDEDGNGVVRADNLYRSWLCGNTYDVHEDSGALSGAANNSRAGIQLLQGDLGAGSLEWLRLKEGPLLTEAQRESEWFNTGFDSLFCANYIGQYRNPRTNAQKFRGVCIRDNRPTWRWRSIVQADREARDAWVYFGNIMGSTTVPLTAENAGYQKASGIFRGDEENMTNWNFQWGSGGRGDLPPNWCSAYMREMLCHIAFPQYAGPRPANTAAWNAGDTPLASQVTDLNELLVRPVCYDFCESILDNCNRAEPEYSNSDASVANVAFPWLQHYFNGTGLQALTFPQNLNQAIDVDENWDPANPKERALGETNTFWCDAWNRGFQLAQAGTGTGLGDDEDVGGLDFTKRFCATWSAGSGLAPTLASLLVAFVALVAGGI